MNDPVKELLAFSVPPLPAAVSARTMARAGAVLTPHARPALPVVQWLLITSATIYAADACLKMAVIFGG